MFSYVFDGKLGEFFAPRPDPRKDIMSLLRGGRYEQVISILQSYSGSLKLDEPDSSGLSIMHFACALGAMEIVVELLSQGCEVNLMSAKGYFPIHYAAMNDHKGIIEILLRSGSDPSIPAGPDGIVAAELCQRSDVRDLLLRNRGRSDFITPTIGNQEISNGKPLNDEKLTRSTSNSGKIASKKSSFSKIIPDLSDLNKDSLSIVTKNSSSDSSDDEDEQLQSGGCQVVEIDSIFSSDSGDDYNINRTISIDNTPISVSVSTVTDIISNLSLTIAPSPIQSHTTATALATPPPPSNSLYYRSQQMHKPSDNIFELPDFSPNKQLSEQILAAAISTANSLKMPLPETERRRNLFKCCQQTHDPKQLQVNRLREILSKHPDLATVRAADQGNIATDGATLLHCAAQWGNTAAINVLLHETSPPGAVSSWAVDLQGRVPLHLAAEWNRSEAAVLLRQAMNRERQLDPVGINAPIDLTGTTPLGWTARRGMTGTKAVETHLFSPGDPSILPATPYTERAHSPRKGSLAAHTLSSQLGFPYAFSKAPGWRGYMEDVVVVSNPLPLIPQWSLFGVLDGHGGAFCSHYLSSLLPDLLQEHIRSAKAKGIWKIEHDDTPDDSSFAQVEQILKSAIFDADRLLAAQPRMAVTVIETSQPDNHLAAQDTGRTVKYVTQDSSGSTAMLSLVSDQFVLLMSVGDSRAVLAQSPVPPSGATATLSPFQWSSQMMHSQSPSPSPAKPEPSSASTAIPLTPGKQQQQQQQHHLLAIALTVDHKLDLPEERQRAEEAGGIVEAVPSADSSSAASSSSVWQVYTAANPNRLRMSRSLGDLYLKQRPDLPQDRQIVTCDPDIRIMRRSERDVFLVQASDGIFDVMTNQEAVDLIAAKLGYTALGGPVGGLQGQSGSELLAAACDALLAECLDRGSRDNMSVVLVLLAGTGSGSSGSGSAIGRKASRDGVRASTATRVPSLTSPRVAPPATPTAPLMDFAGLYPPTRGTTPNATATAESATRSRREDPTSTSTAAPPQTGSPPFLASPVIGSDGASAGGTSGDFSSVIANTTRPSPENSTATEFASPIEARRLFSENRR